MKARTEALQREREQLQEQIIQILEVEKNHAEMMLLKAQMDAEWTERQHMKEQRERREKDKRMTSGYSPESAVPTKPKHMDVGNVRPVLLHCHN